MTRITYGRRIGAVMRGGRQRVAKVEKLKAAAIARGATWQTPIDFVNVMRATQSHAVDVETLLQYQHTTTW